MFLNQLNLEERKAFIELAYYTAKIDNVFADEEKYFIETYKNEAGIEYYDIENYDFDKIVSKFKNKRVKNIVLLEITALIYADKKVTIEESNLLKDLQRKASEIWVKNYFELLEQGSNFING